MREDLFFIQVAEGLLKDSWGGIGVGGFVYASGDFNGMENGEGEDGV